MVNNPQRRTKGAERQIQEGSVPLKQMAQFGLESLPGVGEAIIAKDIAQDVKDEQYLSAGLNTLALGVGAIPGAGDILNRPIRAAAKKFRKADIKEAEKLVDNPDKLKEWQEANTLPESQRQKNIPESQQAAEDLFQGNIKSKEARKRIKEVFPEPKLYTAEDMPEMPTVTDVVGSMGKKAEKGILGVKGFDLEPGQRVGARLDIPAYNNYDKWVVSIHDGKIRNGSVVGYGQAIRLKNIEFGSDPEVALDIAKGKRVAKKSGEEKPMGKATIARVFGDYVPEDPYELQEFAKKVLADKDSGWTQVGMNPYRGSYFYSKETGKVVTRADEVIQVGPLVLAKNVTEPKLSELKELFSQKKARTKDGKLRIFNEGGLSTDYEDRIISEEVRRKMDDAVAKAEAEGIEVESEYYTGSDLDKMKEIARLNDIGVITGPFADYGRGVNVPRTPTLFNLFAMEEELSHNRQPEDPDPKKGSRPRFKAGPANRLLNLKGMYDEEVRAKDEALEKTGGLLPKGKRTAELTRRSYAEMFKNGINRYVEETGDTETVREIFKQYPELRNVEEVKYPKEGVPFKQGGAVPMNTMTRQMELFDEGGLMDEGGTVDPVSGNEVPPGSTQEEVRDDVPAQLSEGEFVFPADVVRYIGLETLMRMRQEAKMGLAQMEAMGQMGNSEEATIPDDLPFDMYDLEVEDDGLEMQVGGSVPAAPTPTSNAMSGTPASTVGGFVNQIQPLGGAVSNLGIAPTPLTAASATQVDPNLQGTQFTPTSINPVTPTFQQQIGAGVVGVDFEFVEYTNEAGQTIRLRRNKATGQMIDPIPEGFSEKVKEEEQVKTTPTTGVGTQTARVSDGDAKEKEGTGPRGASISLGGKAVGPAIGGGIPGTRFAGPSRRVEGSTLFNVDFDIPGVSMLNPLSMASFMADMISKDGPGLPKDGVARISAVGGSVGAHKVKISSVDYNKIRNDITGDLAKEYQSAGNLAEALENGTYNYNSETRTITDNDGNVINHTNLPDDLAKGLDKLGESIYNDVQKDREDGDTMIEAGSKLSNSEKAALSMYNDKQFANFLDDKDDPAPSAPSAPSGPSFDDSAVGRGSEDRGGRDVSQRESDTQDPRGEMRATGGLIDKQMKRSGLASKK